MKRKIFYAITAMLLFCKTQAQIDTAVSAISSTSNAQAQLSDADAKLQYQKIEDSYDSGDYGSAINLSVELKNKMGKWTPKVLYMYLRSWYKVDDKKKESYKFFEEMKRHCDDFFAMIDKSTYPQDKYNEIVTAQKYFESKMNELAYQKDRKPQDAIDFLNESAKKFPELGGCSFKLNNNWLIISTGLYTSVKSKFFNYKSDYAYYAFIYRERYFIDLSKTTEIDPNGLLSGFDKVDTNTDKRIQDFFWGKIKAHGLYFGFNENKAYKAVTKRYEENKNDSNYLRINNEEPDQESELFEPVDYRWGESDDEKKRSFAENTVFKFFNTSVQQFKDGNYAKRIVDAFQFLIDSFPKQKSEGKEQPKSKF